MEPETLPWWKSRVIVGTAISAVFKALFALLVLLDIDAGFTDEELEPLVDALVLLVSLAGDFIAARARVRQVYAPPITLRKEP